MPGNIAAYYKDELFDWNKSIDFYINEMNEFTLKLGEVIRRNSVVGIAEKVEVHQNLLNRLMDKFFKLQVAIQRQEGALKTDSTLIGNAQIDHETENHQNELRHRMQAAEKEYIDVKFNCYNFLSGTLKK